MASNLSKRLDKLERGIQQLLDTNSGPIYLTEDEAIPEGRDAIRIIMNWVEAEPQLEGEEVHSTKSSRFVSAAKNLSHSCYSGEFREAKSGLTLVGRSWPDIRGSSAGVSSRFARATKDQKSSKIAGVFGHMGILTIAKPQARQNVQDLAAASAYEAAIARDDSKADWHFRLGLARWKTADYPAAKTTKIARWQVYIVSIFSILLLYVIICCIFFPAFFVHNLFEDRYVEWAQFYLLTFTSVLSFRSAIDAWRKEGEIQFFYVLVGLFCAAVAMEEISWGQRLIGFESPLFLRAPQWAG